MIKRLNALSAFASYNAKHHQGLQEQSDIEILFQEICFMALTLLKMVGTGNTVTKPTVKNYFHTMSGAYNASGTFSIAAAAFQTDTGGAASALTLKTNSNGYYMLFINGLLQQANLIKSIQASKLVIALTTGNLDLKASEIVTLSVTNFAPVTTFQG